MFFGHDLVTVPVISLLRVFSNKQKILVIEMKTSVTKIQFDEPESDILGLKNPVTSKFFLIKHRN